MEHERINNHAPKTYTEIFNERFPFYLSIGMTADQFWEGECTLPVFYRQAYTIKQKREFDDMDFNAWLQGRYITEAILACFAKDYEYPIKPHNHKEAEEKRTEEEIMIDNVEYFRKLVQAKNGLKK